MMFAMLIFIYVGTWYIRIFKTIKMLLILCSVPSLCIAMPVENYYFLLDVQAGFKLSLELFPFTRKVFFWFFLQLLLNLFKVSNLFTACNYMITNAGPPSPS